MRDVRTQFWIILLALSLATSSAALRAEPIELVCHRGANEFTPENTQAAAELCIKWKVAYVEIDVRTSKDGVMYILHDTTVDRTTNGTGKLRDLTSEEIDELDAGSWFDPKFAGQKVPRLKPYLQWIKGQAKVYFDVKDADLEELIPLVYELGMENDCFFWFGNPLQASRFRKLDSELALKVNASSPKEVRRVRERLGADIVEVGLDKMSDEMVDVCQELDVKLMIYHPQKSEEGFRRVVQWDPDMVNLNNADLFQEIERDVNGS